MGDLRCNRAQVRNLPVSILSHTERVRIGINVTIAPGGPDARALTLHTQDSAGLRTIIQEYKRLQAASAASQATIQTFSWIAPYTHARATKKSTNALNVYPPS